MVTTFTVAKVGDLTPALLSQIVNAEVATVTAKPLDNDALARLP